MTLQTIATNREGKTILHTEDYDKFITSILSIPENQKFEEKLLSFDIKIDGNMANAWTPYEFWFNDQFSHCGVNSFQLIKVDKLSGEIIKLKYFMGLNTNEISELLNSSPATISRKIKFARSFLKLHNSKQ